MENDAPPHMEELFDADDPPPEVGYSDLHWWFWNHFAEGLARYARMVGLY